MLTGTAGHIDHGKTALIKALTGVDADRLKEEKARGITIDLGYAYAPRPDGGVLGFIDVPGHERYVHNMLAGATGVDQVLLVVAADDGVMPQTREHLEIIDLLGITRGVVAVTQIDRVDAARVAQVLSEIDALLAGTVLAGSPVFPVSSVTGAGVAALRAYLEASAEMARTVDGHFRLAVDRCFTLAGTGTVVTGTVFAGSVRVGDRLLVSPRGLEVRVRGIHAQNRVADAGHAGQRCALNIAGAEKSDVARGDWLLEPVIHSPTARLDVRLRAAPGARTLKHWTPVHLHLGAADVLARVSLLEGTSLAPGARGLAQLVLERPVGALHGDRLILRDQSASQTLAGGVVLDPFAPARKTRTPQRLAILGACESAAPRAALEALLKVSDAGVDLAAFACGHNLSAASAETLYRDLPMVVVATAAGGRFGFSPMRLDALEQAITDTLAATHRHSPEQLGMDGRQLRRAATPELPWELFSALVGTLLNAQRVARHGPWLHLPNHRITLTAAEEKLWRAVAPLLRATPFQPPWVRDLARVLHAPEVQVRMLLRRVTLIGDTYEVLHDRFFTREAVTQLARIAAELDAANGEVRAAEFRDRIGSGRKLAIQILEYFDRTGFSRRVGDAHRMRDAALLVDKFRSAGAAQVTGRDSHPGGAA